MTRFTRPEVVDLLADAYRNSRHSAYARALIANRHLDCFPAECEEALARVMVETEAELIVLDEQYRLAVDE